MSTLKVWKAWLEKEGGGIPTSLERAAWFDTLKDLSEDVHKSALNVYEAWVEKGGTAAPAEQSAWLAMLDHSDNVRRAAVALWYEWGRVSLSRLWKRKKLTLYELERWLVATVVWAELEGGIAAIQKHLLSDAKLAEMLQISHYPAFQHIARQALAKKKTPSSRPYTRKSSLHPKRALPASQPQHRPTSQPTSRPTSLSTSRPSFPTSRPSSRHF